MEMQQLQIKSLRFFPHWNQNNPDQIIGFLNLVCYILNKKSFINNWVELGSFGGESANMLLGFPSIKHIDCVDKQQNLIRNLAIKFKKDIAKNKCSLHSMTSYDFLNSISKNYMDVIYIDACHDYDFVKQDIELSFDKLSSNSFLCGHDYNIEYQTFPGVIKAVDEFAEKHGLSLVRFIDDSWLMEKE